MIAVIYKSLCGHTKEYAEWISQELDADLIENTKFSPQTLEKYDVIIYGGGLYASGILGASLISNNYDKLTDKKLIVFMVGATASPTAEGYKKVISHNFSDKMQGNIKFFYLRGGIDYSKLSFVHKMMLATKKKAIEKMTERDEEQELFLKTFGSSVKFSDKNSIVLLVDYVKGLTTIQNN